MSRPRGSARAVFCACAAVIAGCSKSPEQRAAETAGQMRFFYAEVQKIIATASDVEVKRLTLDDEYALADRVNHAQEMLNGLREGEVPKDDPAFAKSRTLFEDAHRVMTAAVALSDAVRIQVDVNEGHGHGPRTIGEMLGTAVDDFVRARGAFLTDYQQALGADAR